MTPHHERGWSVLRFCALVCVYGSGVIAILASGSRPPTSPYRPSPADIDETKPHSAVRLVAVTPSIALTDQRVVMIDRHYEEKSSGTSLFRLRTSRYIPKGTILVVDRDIQFGFGFSGLDLTSSEGREQVSSIPLGLNLIVRNRSPRSINIDWNAVTVIDATGRIYRVVHRGVKMADRSAILAPSTIPPGATLDDFVYPQELMSFSGGRYGSGWTGINFFEAIKPGQQFKLYLPVKQGNDIVEYQFVFEVTAPAQ